LLGASDQSRPELNAGQKKPQPGKQISLNLKKNPVTRLLEAIMDRKGVLTREQIEVQKNSIPKASRKLVTISISSSGSSRHVSERSELALSASPPTL
jgi:hypothetical protein